MGHYDDNWDAAEEAERKEFEKRLKRRNELIQIVSKKYPEVMELLGLVYQEKRL